MEKPLILFASDSGSSTLAAHQISIPTKSRSVKHAKIRICLYGAAPAGQSPDNTKAL